MPVILPEAIARYFAADRKNGEAVAHCFTAAAIVVDERQSHEGHEAIARWKTEASGRYEYVSEPLAVASEGGTTVVTARVSGNFPGSPVDLRYAFTLQGDLIAHLEIVA